MTGCCMRATLALNGLINQIYSTFCQTLQPFYNVEKKVPDKKTIRSRRATRSGRGGGALPCPFLKIKKNCPDFRKKDPDCVHPYVKFAIYNVVLRVSSRRDFKIFPCGNFFSGIFDEIFIGVP